jgi:hypothetical protein
MIKEYFLSVPHYLQVDCYNDSNEKCGAACAQMVLHDINPQRFFTKGEQNVLFGQIRVPPPGAGNWHNPPQGIKRVLNQQKPATRLTARAALAEGFKDIFKDIYGQSATVPSTPYEFVIYGDSSPEVNPNPGIPRAIGARDQIAQIELLSRQLIRTIGVNGVAPILAVREDNAHWIVVNGFRVEDDYRDADLRQRNKIKAMIIRNPLGRYTYRSVSCGNSSQLTHQITHHQCNLNSYAEDVVPFVTWVREYMFSDWAETFVEVCDWSTLVFDELLSRIHCHASRPLRTSWPRAIWNRIVRVYRAIHRMFPERQITAKEAENLAKRAIEEFKLWEMNKQLIPDNTADPLRVKRLDRADGDYFLVPVKAKKPKEDKKQLPYEEPILAFINILATGEFDGATVLPIRDLKSPEIPDVGQLKEHAPAIREEDREDILEFYNNIRKRNEHHIAQFDDHPEFKSLTAGTESSLCKRKIRLPGVSDPLEITSVTRDETAPYVWRPCPESFSASRPFHNLRITVEGRPSTISYYLPVDDYCIPLVDGDITLPSSNYLERLVKCIKERAGAIVDDVLAMISRSGTTAMVIYKSNRTLSTEDEKVEMKRIICSCLRDHPYSTLTHFRFKAFRTNAFLTRRRGGGDDAPLISSPAPGGGDDGHLIDDCP